MDNNLDANQPGRCSGTVSKPECSAHPKEECAEARTKSSFVSRILPRWLGQFVGQTILRVCPAAHREDPCAGCELRVLCKCAQDDSTASARVEQRVWTVLAACGAVVILYCFL